MIGSNTMFSYLNDAYLSSDFSHIPYTYTYIFLAVSLSIYTVKDPALSQRPRSTSFPPVRRHSRFIEVYAPQEPQLLLTPARPHPELYTWVSAFPPPSQN